MPPKYANSEVAVQRLAGIIASLVVDIKDVGFTAESKENLILPISRELKAKLCQRFSLEIQRAWAENKYGLKDLVKKKLKHRFNRDGQVYGQDSGYNCSEKSLSGVRKNSSHQSATVIDEPVTVEVVGHDGQDDESDSSLPGLETNLDHCHFAKVADEAGVVEVVGDRDQDPDGNLHSNGHIASERSLPDPKQDFDYSLEKVVLEPETSTIVDNNCQNDAENSYHVDNPASEVSSESNSDSYHSISSIETAERFLTSPKCRGVSPSDNPKSKASSYRKGVDTGDDISENESDNDNVDSYREQSDSNSWSDESTDRYVEPPPTPAVRKSFPVSLGSITVTSETLTTNGRNVNPHRVKKVLSRLMLKNLNFHCPLSYYGGIRFNTQKVTLVAYANCRSPSHTQSWRFEVADYRTSHATIYFRTTECTEIIHDGPKIFCSVTGEDRDNFKEKLQGTTPRMLQLELVGKIDPEIADDGHMQEMVNIETIHTMNSEENRKNDTILRSNDLSDLFQKHLLDQETSDPYIRHAGFPLSVHMFSEEQLDIVDSNDIIGYFDGTGSVVRKPKNTKCKRIMYYALIMNKNSALIPQGECIKARQNVPSLSSFLKDHKHFVIEHHGQWPLFRVIVVDWSWALINSFLGEWNMMTMTTYLEELYDCVTNDTEPRSDLVIVHTCCAHFQKRVSRNIHRKFPKYLKIKNFILECVGLMIHCRTLASLDEVFENFVKILTTTSRAVADCSIITINELLETIKDAGNLDEEICSDKDLDKKIVSDDKSKGSVFAESPFYKRYYEKLSEIKNNSVEGDSDNEYYAPKIADYVTQSLMPFAPMWSALILKHVAPEHQRLSNANVESFFTYLKKYVLNGQRNLKIGRFLTKVREHKTKLCKEVRLGGPCKGRRRRKKAGQHVKANANAPNNPVVKDIWQRKRPAQYSHLEGRQLGRIAKKAKIERDRTSTPKQRDTPQNKPPIAKKAKIERDQTSTLKPVDTAQNTARIAKKSQIETVPASTPEQLDTCSETPIPRHEQSFLNRSDNSDHANALSNGLFQDSAYYMQLETPQFTVGRYGSITDAPIIAFDEFQLFSEQYRTLRPRQYLDGDVIDAYTVATLDFESNVVYVPTTMTGYLLGEFSHQEKAKEWRMYNVGSSLKGTMFMPYVRYAHWCLLIVDIDAKTIMHLDPILKGTGARGREAIQKFKQYIAECTVIGPNVRSDIDWTEIQFEGYRLMQKDAFNCGLYVLYYIECLSKGVKFDRKFDPNAYRLHVAEALLILSRDMKKVCQYCFSNRYHDLIMCNTCRRWAHVKCLNSLQGTNRSLKEWSKSTASYRCALCAHEVRPWMRY